MNQDKEKIVVDLFIKNTPNKEIAKEAQISERDISKYLRSYLQKKEGKKEVEYTKSIISQAYKLYSEGKDTIEVAISLNMNSEKAIQLFKEYLQLVKIDKFFEIYNKLSSYNNGIDFFLQLYQAVITNGYGLDEIINLLRITNNHLPSIYSELEVKMREKSNVEFQITNLNNNLQNLNSVFKKIQKDTDTIAKINREMGEEISNFKNQKEELICFINHLRENEENFIPVRNTFEEIIKSCLKDFHQMIRLFIIVMFYHLSDPQKHDKIMDNIISLTYSADIKKTIAFGYTFYEPAYAFKKESIFQYTFERILDNREYIDWLVNDMDKTFHDLFIKSFRNEAIHLLLKSLGAPN